SVLMLPWLAHGHLSPFLELAKRLNNRNFHIYLCSTPINLNSIRENLSQKYSLSIQLVELHLPSMPELPPHLHTTNGLPPHLMPTLKKAFDMSIHSFSNILETLNPDLLIYDFLQPWARAIASSLDIPAVEFLSTGAATTCFIIHASRNPGTEFPFPAIYLRDYETDNFNHLLGNKNLTEGCNDRSFGIILIKSFKEIEAKYLDYLSASTNKKIVPVGSLVRDPFDEYNEKMKIFEEWLDKKEQSSTVFVSFGSEYFLSMGEIKEVALGLELSKVLVVRFPMGEKISIEEALPNGFLERVGERGTVVEGWAPQARILSHSSIGGFVGHCGWSSVMESMKFGVPTIAMPMHLDQPFNARLVEEVGVGIEVKRDKNGRLEREEVAKSIKEVVVGKVGEKVKEKAKELRNNMRYKEDKEIDGLVKELVQL
ncbi:LOW QUALITY PROTEIN: UDPGT domain-containing protein, partial [Cephalotus follicularis]